MDKVARRSGLHKGKRRGASRHHLQRSQKPHGGFLPSRKPGTPFSALPAHWTCPQCEGAATQFMVLAEARP
jgi:rubredoxin